MISTVFDLHNWYPWMRDETFKTEFVVITKEEKETWIECMNGKADFPNGLGTRINHASRKIGFPVFVKLSSRSSKDYSELEHKNIRSVVRALSNSMRIYEDLKGFVCQSPIKVVAIREYKPIEKKSEFRCFSKDGKFVGMSQYFYKEDFGVMDHVEAAQEYAEKVHKKLVGTCGFRDFIFDIGYVNTDGWKLIELNPFSSDTDPCLFDWKTDKFEKMEIRLVSSHSSIGRAQG